MEAWIMPWMVLLVYLIAAIIATITTITILLFKFYEWSIFFCAWKAVREVNGKNGWARISLTLPYRELVTGAGPSFRIAIFHNRANPCRHCAEHHWEVARIGIDRHKGFRKEAVLDLFKNSSGDRIKKFSYGNSGQMIRELRRYLNNIIDHPESV